jgi:hypothetical protein
MRLELKSKTNVYSNKYMLSIYFIKFYQIIQHTKNYYILLY